MDTRNLIWTTFEFRPKVNELVKAKVVKVMKRSARVLILEYNLMGIIRIGELKRKRIRTMKKYISPGKIDVLLVVFIDRRTGEIFLSKKKAALVEPERVELCEKRYLESKRVSFHLNAPMAILLK